MRIIAHRGYWIKPNEKNTAIAFERALRLNFGIETDIRDVQGKLVVSHDMPSGGEMDFSDFLDLCLLYSKARPLALNIKSDCLHDELRNILEIKKISNFEYFVFDMSLPDTMSYVANKMSTYIRHSENETIPKVIFPQVSGVWLDAFYDEWYSEADFLSLLSSGKQICIVSPELHGRNHMPLWIDLRKWQVHMSSQVELCTDFPSQARDFFNA